MSAHQDLLFIKQTSAILAKHCGKKQAQAILNEAEQRLEAQWADPAFARRAVAQCSGPGAPEDDLFTELWLELARRRPSLFGPVLGDLSAAPRGVSLAWLYARTQQHPLQLQAGAVGANDKKGQQLCGRLSGEVFPALVALDDAGALPTVATTVWRLQPECVLDSYLRHHDWHGINLFCEPALRCHTFLRSGFMKTLTGRRPPHENDAFVLLLHEQIHASLTQGAMPQQAVELTPLRTALNEAVVEVLCACALGLAFEKPLPLVLARTMYTREVTALLSLLPALSVGDVPRLAAVGHANLQAHSDEAATELLNTLDDITLISGDAPRTTDEWLAYFTSEDVAVEARSSAQANRAHAGVSTLTRSENGHWVRYYDYADGPKERITEEHFRCNPFRFHRELGPAAICENGDRVWWREGKLDRQDGPAIEGTDGYREFRVHGKLDRKDGPAIIETSEDGTHIQSYYRNNKRHREDGPAVTEAHEDGTLIEGYYRRGKLDREDGPAIIETYADGSRFETYYRGGRRHREDGPALILAGADGTRVEQYHRRGKLHRDDGPAIIETRTSGSNTEKYYRDGELHRTNGPAIIETRADGTHAKHYYQHGKLHRAHGTRAR